MFFRGFLKLCKHGSRYSMLYFINEDRDCKASPFHLLAGENEKSEKILAFSPIKNLLNHKVFFCGSVQKNCGGHTNSRCFDILYKSEVSCGSKKSAKEKQGS